eukprot:5750518-Pleurochrysis_carterae.AAC.1
MCVIARCARIRAWRCGRDSHLASRDEEEGVAALARIEAAVDGLEHAQRQARAEQLLHRCRIQNRGRSRSFALCLCICALCALCLSLSLTNTHTPPSRPACVARPLNSYCLFSLLVSARKSHVQSDGRRNDAWKVAARHKRTRKGGKGASQGRGAAGSSDAHIGTEMRRDGSTEMRRDGSTELER